MYSKSTGDPQAVALVDRLEHLARAYERLGKLTRDDEKTRQLRLDTIAELAAARLAVLARMK